MVYVKYKKALDNLRKVPFLFSSRYWERFLIFSGGKTPENRLATEIYKMRI